MNNLWGAAWETGTVPKAPLDFRIQDDMGMEVRLLLQGDSALHACMPQHIVSRLCPALVHASPEVFIAWTMSRFFRDAFRTAHTEPCNTG